MKRNIVFTILIVVALLTLTVFSVAVASEPPPPNWDVSGTWEGNSGLTGNLAYHFFMTLSQDASGSVTGTFYYTNASPTGTINGHVQGNEFYFIRNDTSSSYWASCNPCIISADGSNFHGYGLGPGQNVEWEAWGQATPAVVDVMIDIKPGSDPNCFNSNGHGVIPVAIIGSADFDASTVNPSSVTLDGAEVRVKGKSGNAGSFDDINGDGFQDLVLQITDDSAYATGDTLATLSGSTYDGVLIEGIDSICIVP